MNGTAAIGTGTTWARADHIHPSDTSRVPITGVTNASNAAAGQVGEYIISQVLVASAVALTTNVAANVTSITLTAGDWDCGGNVEFQPSATVSYGGGSINTTSATRPDASLEAVSGANGGSGFSVGVTAPSRRFNVSVTTTLYLIAVVGISSGTCTGCGTVWARRAR